MIRQQPKTIAEGQVVDPARCTILKAENLSVAGAALKKLANLGSLQASRHVLRTQFCGQA